MAKKKVSKVVRKSASALKIEDQCKQICQLKDDLVAAGNSMEKQSRYIEELRENIFLLSAIRLKSVVQEAEMARLVRELLDLNSKLMTELDAVGYATCNIALSEMLEGDSELIKLPAVAESVSGEVVSRSLYRVMVYGAQQRDMIKKATEKVFGGEK